MRLPKSWGLNLPSKLTMTEGFKKGDRVRINHEFRPDWHGKEGEITVMALNGALIRFPNGRGTMVKFEHLEHV